MSFFAGKVALGEEKKKEGRGEGDLFSHLRRHLIRTHPGEEKGRKGKKREEDL